MCQHDHEALAVAQADPTRTTTVRENYASKLRGALAGISAKIRSGVGERDVFGLDRGTEALATEIPFQFTTTGNSEKHNAFMDWLERQIENDVLTVVTRGDNTYIQSSYEAGIRHAQAELRRQGVEVTPQQLEAFSLPVHQESLELLFARNFSELKGITEEMSRQISRELTEGFAQGQSPRTIARSITDRVDKIGKTRATTMARTEVINAHAEATLNEYERHSVDNVTVRAEFTTAGDRRVCPLCRFREGEVVTIQEAREDSFRFEASGDQPPSLSGTYSLKPPIHPNCRCAFIPVVS